MRKLVPLRYVPECHPLDGHLLHLPFSYLVKKFAKANFARGSLRPAKHIEEGDHDQTYDQPEC